MNKKAIQAFTKITTGIYKNEYWKFRKEIEIVNNAINSMYHTYLNLLLTGEIEVNNIDEKIEIEGENNGTK